LLHSNGESNEDLHDTAVSRHVLFAQDVIQRSGGQRHLFDSHPTDGTGNLSAAGNLAFYKGDSKLTVALVWSCCWQLRLEESPWAMPQRVHQNNRLSSMPLLSMVEGEYKIGTSEIVSNKDMMCGTGFRNSWQEPT
jgi:hypothetical protein